MDNKIALSYLVKMGGTHNKDLLGLSKQIWDYLQSKKITITAEYLPGHLNVTADWESRNFQDKSDWKLSPVVFAKICQKLGTASIDLFASRMSHQLPLYMEIREVRQPMPCINHGQKCSHMPFPHSA